MYKVPVPHTQTEGCGVEHEHLTPAAGDPGGVRIVKEGRVYDIRTCRRCFFFFLPTLMPCPAAKSSLVACTGPCWAAFRLYCTG